MRHINSVRILAWKSLLLAGLAAAGCQNMRLTSTPGPARATATLEPAPIATASPASPAAVGTSTQLPAATATPARPTTQPSGDSFALVSGESLLSFTRALTSIQPYSGWRNSASQGEAEALDYLTGVLQDYDYLVELGLDIERQPFRVYTGTEFWEQQLTLTVAGEEIQVRAEAMRGNRDRLDAAMRFDSDGQLNDSESDPVTADGPVVWVSTPEQIESLKPQAAAGKVLLVDYALIDRALLNTQIAGQRAAALLNLDPAAILLVTQFSNQPGVSHGTYAGDSSVFTGQDPTLPKMPILFFRLEDLAGAGISSLEQLSAVQAADLSWDADVFSPANSANLIVRIPGQDASRAVLLGAHIDSPNSPGALDDGSGSVVLLEVARTLNESRRQPPVDVYLLWFGSEELGLWGSGNFAAAHSELLDRTIGMLQIDDLSFPIEGITGFQNLNAWPYSGLDSSARGLPWAEHLSEQVAARGIRLETTPYFGKVSDNSNFDGFNVPNAQLAYGDEDAMAAQGGFWFAGHIHGPYDTVELVEQVIEPLEEMVVIALSAALELPEPTVDLRHPPDPRYRAVIVSSHAEAPHFSPAEMNVFGMALALEGYDVDVVPYGEKVTREEIDDAQLVVVLPVFDLPSPAGQPEVYDEAWSAEEIDALREYAGQGGLLVLTNSANRLKHGQSAWEASEDWPDTNDLTQEFGVQFVVGPLQGDRLEVIADHPLVAGVSSLRTAADNTIPISAQEGLILAQTSSGQAAAVLTPVGDQGGEALVLGDLSLLSTDFSGPGNAAFWRNLARYAAMR